MAGVEKRLSGLDVIRNGSSRVEMVDQNSQLDNSQKSQGVHPSATMPVTSSTLLREQCSFRVVTHECKSVTEPLVERFPP